MKYRKVYLLLVHKNPLQVRLLLDELDDDRSLFFLHVDKKIDIRPFKQIVSGKNTIFITKRFKCRWGRFSLVDATIESFSEILNYMKAYCHGTRFHVILISGEDFPNWSNNKINNFLINKIGHSIIEHWELPSSRWFAGGLFRFNSLFITNPIEYPLIHKYLNKIINKLKLGWIIPLNRLKSKYSNIVLYGQTQWFIISDELSCHLVNLHRHASLKNIFRYTFAPDETYIITLLHLTCPNNRIENLKTHFAKFIHFDPSPVYLSEGNLNEIPKDIMFSRKFSTYLESDLFKKLVCRRIDD